MYTIGQVAAMFQLPISTLRYYDKEGLFPYLKRKAGIRWFSEQELEALRGFELEDKPYRQGASTYPQRYELFVRQRDAVEAEIRHMQRTLDMIRYKCWYYENAMADGNEERVKTLTPAEMPQEIREAYEGAHRL